MLEFEARARDRWPDVRELHTVRALSQYESKADYVRADDLGLTEDSLVIHAQAESLRSAVRIIAVASGLGLLGAVVGAVDFVLDTVSVPGLQPLIERGFGCDPIGGCQVILGLPLPVLLGLIVSGTASLFAVFGHMFIGFVDFTMVSRARCQISKHSQSIRSERFVHLGSGQLIYSLGDAGLQISIGGRVAVFEWSTFDGTLLLLKDRDSSIWPEADPKLLDGPELEHLFKLKGRSEAVDRLHRSARAWSERNKDYIDLPLRLDLSVDAKGRRYGAGDCKGWREFLRIHSRYFHGAGGNYLSWAEFVGACAFMIAQCDPNFGEIGDEVG